MQSMLSGQVDYVIGVDTHRDTNTAAVVEASTGAVIDHRQCTTDAMGYKRCYAFATSHAPGRRVWAIEGTRQLRRLTYHLPPRARRMGRRDRQTGPPRPPRRSQDR